MDRHAADLPSRWLRGQPRTMLKLQIKFPSLLRPLMLGLIATQLTATSPEAAERPDHLPAPLPDHPGNIFLAGETVQISLPTGLTNPANGWRLLDDQQRLRKNGELPPDPTGQRPPLTLGKLGVGWYRLEFGNTNQSHPSWTTLAVLQPLKSPTPPDSPVAVDAAIAWFAKDDPIKQKRFASLAALAGVSWVRDRLRWSEIQPRAGELRPPPTTYDTAADAQRDAGLQVLQVFHDTPDWAREEGETSGRFATDLRHVFEFSRALAMRFKGRVAAWEPWNEANVATFGAHTVDQMCSWQKAAWLGFKAGDPTVVVGWNVTAAVPTPAHTKGVLANETWPYFDTYNIHTYDWSHAYAELWKPAREAAAGRPIWVTEADRGTPHRKDPPWYDQEPHLEKLKAQWIAQSYASSLFAGAARHFHFILGNYQENNTIQFGLLRLDLTPRPAYVALAAVGRCLASAQPLGRWQPDADVHVYAFRARPDGRERDVLVIWAEKDVDWNGRGVTQSAWKLPVNLEVQEVVDYLGRSNRRDFPAPLTSAPVFVLLPPGQAARLPLESPPLLAVRRSGTASPVVLQLVLPRSAARKVEDVPWSEGYVYQADFKTPLEFQLSIYNFGTSPVTGRVRLESQPPGWNATLVGEDFQLAAMQCFSLRGNLQISPESSIRDGWVIFRADCGKAGKPVLAFRVITSN